MANGHVTSEYRLAKRLRFGRRHEMIVVEFHDFHVNGLHP